jgi:hypothetical protein
LLTDPDICLKAQEIIITILHRTYSPPDPNLALKTDMLSLGVLSGCALALSTASAAVTVTVNSTQYFSGLANALTDAGFSHFLNAVEVANTTTAGQALINSLFSNGSFTIYAPIDQVCHHLRFEGYTDKFVRLGMTAI